MVLIAILFATIFTTSTSIRLTDAIKCYNGSCTPPGCEKKYGDEIVCDSALKRCAKVVLVNAVVGEIIRFCTQTCTDGYIRNPQGELFIYCCSQRDLCNAGSSLRMFRFQRFALLTFNLFAVFMLLFLFYYMKSPNQLFQSTYYQQY